MMYMLWEMQSMNMMNGTYHCMYDRQSTLLQGYVNTA